MRDVLIKVGMTAAAIAAVKAGCLLQDATIRRPADPCLGDARPENPFSQNELSTFAITVVFAKRPAPKKMSFSEGDCTSLTGAGRRVCA